MKRLVFSTLIIALFFSQQSFAAFQCPDWFNTLSLKVAKDDIKTSVLGAVDTQGKILAGRKAIVDNPQWAKDPLTSALYQKLIELVNKNVIDEIEEQLADPKYPEFSNTFGAQAVFDTVDEALRKEVEIDIMRAVRDVIGTAEILIASNTTLSADGLNETIRKAVAGAEKRLLDKVASGKLPLSIADLTNIIARIKTIIQNIQFSRGYKISETIRVLTLSIKTAEAVKLERNLGVDLDAWVKAKGITFQPKDPGAPKPGAPGSPGAEGIPGNPGPQAAFGGRLADILKAMEAIGPDLKAELHRISTRVSADIAAIPKENIDPEAIRLAMKKMAEITAEARKTHEEAKVARRDTEDRITELTERMRQDLESSRFRDLQILSLNKRLPPIEIRFLENLKDEAKPPSREDILRDLERFGVEVADDRAQDPDNHAGNYMIFPLPHPTTLSDPYLSLLLKRSPWLKSLNKPQRNPKWEELFARFGHKTYSRSKPAIKMSAIAKARAYQWAVRNSGRFSLISAEKAFRELNNYDRAALNQLAEQMGDVQAALFAFINPDRLAYPVSDVRLAEIGFDPDHLELLSAELLEAVDSIDTLAKHLMEVEQASPSLLTHIDLKLLERVSKSLKLAIQAIEDASESGQFPAELGDSTLEDIGLGILQSIGQDGEELIREITRLYALDREQGLSEFAQDLKKAAFNLPNTDANNLRGLSPATIKILQYLSVLIELED